MHILYIFARASMLLRCYIAGIHNKIHEPTLLGVPWGSVGCPVRLGSSGVLDFATSYVRCENLVSFIIVEMFSKTIQLHVATVRKILRMANNFCGDFNLY